MALGLIHSDSTVVIPTIVRPSGFGLTASIGAPSISVGGVSPNMTINPDSYANTAAYIADVATFNGNNDSGLNEPPTSDATIVTKPGVSGRGLSFTKAIQYHYRHNGTTHPEGDDSFTISRDFLFMSGGVPVLKQEVWCEFNVRYSVGANQFTTGGQVPPHSHDPNDHKLIFGLPQSASGSAGRWAFYIGSGSDADALHPNNGHDMNQEGPWPHEGGTGLNGGPAHNTVPYPMETTVWNTDTWHSVRLQMRCSTTASSADGIWRIWWDGVLIHEDINLNYFDGDVAQPGHDNGPILIRGMSMGRNEDDGPPDRDMYLWWGPTYVYYSNPGW